jgi:hypothetical protein
MQKKNTSKTVVGVVQADGLKTSEEFLKDAKMGWKWHAGYAVQNAEWMDRLFRQMAFEEQLKSWGYAEAEREQIYKWRKTTR